MYLVTGSTGSRKSTTLASLIHSINEERAENILTIEQPIEYIHKPIKSRIEQIEVGLHVDSFETATIAAMRQNPNIIFVGEMRELQTIQNAVTLAETGHVVYGTLHAKSVIDSIDRIIDVFPPEQQEQIRFQIARVLKGVMHQTLVKSDDKVIPLAEQMVIDEVVSSMILGRQKSNTIRDHFRSKGLNGNVHIVDNAAWHIKSNRLTLESVKPYLSQNDYNTVNSIVNTENKRRGLHGYVKTKKGANILNHRLSNAANLPKSEVRKIVKTETPYIGKYVESKYVRAQKKTVGGESIPISSIVNECNIELTQKLEDIENGQEYDSIELSGEPADRRLVLSLFSVKIAGREDNAAEDAVIIDERKKQKLKKVFWDMHRISSDTETTDDGKRILHITISAKTKEEMIEEYAFTRKQKEALETLLENADGFIGAAQRLAISDETAQQVLERLPENLPEGRKRVVKNACSLVGKVNYFWGGKSSAIGWDSGWGKMKRVTAPGSRSTGTIRPFGLDCSGFVTWSFINSGYMAAQIGHGAGRRQQKALAFHGLRQLRVIWRSTAIIRISALSQAGIRTAM